MRLRLNRIAHPVTALGPGRRLAIWVQGCTIGCPGCASVDTWDPSTGDSTETDALASDLAEVIVGRGLTGITLTGGEPTEQGDALADLVTRLQHLVEGRSIDVLLFTGLTEKSARRRAPALWDAVDAAICGPYRPDRPSEVPLVASSNQTVVARTALGAERLADSAPASGRTLQARVSDGDITMIGLPRPGDLARLEAALRVRGVVMEGRSWRT